jgi:hypothetical protein
MIARTAQLSAKTAVLIVCGIVALAGVAVAVNATDTFQASVAKKKRGKKQASFQIRTKVPGTLSPGKTLPVEISLANKRPVNLWIKRLSLRLSIDPAHAAAGCSVARDYRVTQIPKKFFPYKLVKAKKSRKRKKKQKLKWRKLPARKRGGNPKLTMLALPDVNQNACKGATLKISFKSRSTTKKPRSKKRSKR